MPEATPPPVEGSEEEAVETAGTGDGGQMPFQQSVLSVDLYLDIEKDRRGGLSISKMKDSYQESNS
jgi:hypothetical protein